jgi:hypothetical protein
MISAIVNSALSLANNGVELTKMIISRKMPGFLQDFQALENRKIDLERSISKYLETDPSQTNEGDLEYTIREYETVCKKIDVAQKNVNVQLKLMLDSMSNDSQGTTKES